jgi:acyl-CoA synthetase (NDP forming)
VAVESVTGTIGEGNPLDAWGHGEYGRNLPHVLKVLNESPTTDAIAVSGESFDLNPMSSPESDAEPADVIALAAAADRSEKPHYYFNMRPSLMNRIAVERLAKAGVAMITGTRQGLFGFDRMARWAEPLPPMRAARIKAASAGIIGRSTVHEYDAKAMLADFGLSVSREKLVTTIETAKSAAIEVGYPVVLKAVSDDIPHKSEYGLVRVGIADETALISAWSELEMNLNKIEKPVNLAGMLVQEMIENGIEMFAGVSRDPDFGLTLAVGFGGIEIEIMRDFALRLLPLREGDVEAMLTELKGAARLGSIRSKPPADVKSLAAAIYGLADFVASNEDRIEEIDLNPIKVLSEGKGSVIVDALILPKK